jgi:hypothetical protein
VESTAVRSAGAIVDGKFESEFLSLTSSKTTENNMVFRYQSRRLIGGDVDNATSFCSDSDRPTNRHGAISR